MILVELVGMAVQTPSMEQFEAYFQRADLDRDGRISGNEAVTFLQASNLPRQVLAQVLLLISYLVRFHLDLFIGRGCVRRTTFFFFVISI